jgi:hypothetical protein
MNLDYEQNRLLATGATPEPAQEPAKPRRKRKTPPSIKEALAPYFDAQTFNRLIGAGETAELALSKALRSGDPPPEARAMFAALLDLLRPDEGRTQIRSPSDVAALLMAEMSHLDHEQLRVISLDTKNRILAMSILYRGSLNSSLVRVGEVFKEAIRLNAAAIVVVHNHPSGAPDPSPDDVLVTRQIVEAGRLLDIEAVDHLVIGKGCFVSMRERGMGF